MDMVLMLIWTVVLAGANTNFSRPTMTQTSTMVPKAMCEVIRDQAEVAEKQIFPGQKVKVTVWCIPTAKK